MKTVRIIGQPKPEFGWVHRFRNFGEEVYVRYRGACDVSIEEIDASFDAFDVRGVADDEAAIVAAEIEDLLRDVHHLDDAVVVRVSDTAPPDHAVVIVLEDLGEDFGEIAWKHPLWVTPGGRNRALVEEMWAGGAKGITLWSSDVHDWNGILRDIDMHHGADATDEPVNKLLVYGPQPTPEIERALNEYDFRVVIPTPCGFIAMKSS